MESTPTSWSERSEQTMLRVTDIEGGSSQGLNLLPLSFIVTDGKKIDNDMTVYFVNKTAIGNLRNWSVTFTTPSVIVSPVVQKFDQVNVRALLTQNFYQPNSDTIFTQFLMDIERLSLQLKGELEKKGVTITNWASPIKSSQNDQNGVAVKVKKPHLKELITNFKRPMHCVIKITCLYINATSSGMALELIDAMEV